MNAKNIALRVMKTRASIWASALMYCLLLFGQGCQLPMLIDPPKPFFGNDSLILDRSRTDILDVIAGVGKDMGFQVSSLNKSAGAIGLSRPGSVIDSSFGKISSASLGIQVLDGGRKLDITVQVFGNLGTGGQGAATKLLEQFKGKLSARLVKN